MFYCHTTAESDAQELSFTTPFDDAPNPHLAEVLAREREGECDNESGRSLSQAEGEMTLLHLMDDDDDD